MPFMVTVSWTIYGRTSRNVYMSQNGVNNQLNFVDALTALIRGWAVMRFSQTNPHQSAYRHNGGGELSWNDQPDPNGPPVPRTVNLQFTYDTEGWRAGEHVKISMIGVA